MVKLKIGLQIEVLRSFYQPLLTCKPYQNKSLRQCSFCVTPMKVVKYLHLYSVLYVILFFLADRLPNIFVENVKPCFESLVPIKGTGTADSVSFDWRKSHTFKRFTYWCNHKYNNTRWTPILSFPCSIAVNSFLRFAASLSVHSTLIVSVIKCKI